MIKEFYSNGKLLISGEYVVLDGAYGWAIPTKFGQYLRVLKTKSSRLSWKSLDEKGKPWFEAVYEIVPLTEISSSDKATSHTLLKILSEAQRLNSSFLLDSIGLEIEAKLTFPRDWGLGTSSTLINNIANWAKVNPYTLLSRTFGGSGYDIACAQYNTPIVYELKNGLPIIEEVSFNPKFKEQLFFVHLNKKQNSRAAIAAYKERHIDKKRLIEQINQITKKLIAAKQLPDFELLMSRHEQLLSEALGATPVKAWLFPDYFGAIKSLGAWGGDFVLATGNTETPAYFKEKGHTTVIPFEKMML